MVSILPETLSEIGASLVFGSFVGVNPPLKVSFRLPTWITVGLRRMAMPADDQGGNAPPGRVSDVKRLRISVFLSFAARSSEPGH